MSLPRTALWITLVLAPAAAEDTPRPHPVAPPSAAAIQAGIQRGVDYLTSSQNRDGSWGSARRTKDLNIYAPVPGAHHAFHIATSTLALAALVESGDERPDVQAAIDRGEKWLFVRLPYLRRATQRAIYNVWGHAYSIVCLVRLHERAAEDPAKQERIRTLIRDQIDLLERLETVDGGWCYYDRFYAQKPTGSSMGFLTATVLHAFHLAEGIGIKAPERIVRRGVRSIQRQRNPDFTYLYGEYFKWAPVAYINRPGSSAARSQACNLALRYEEDEAVTDEVIDSWLDRLHARGGWLHMGRKRPRPHESWLAISGYFYYYGFYYGARCIEELPAARRIHHKAHMAATLLGEQEPSGAWWDYPLYDYGHAYGTGYALSALIGCR